MARPLFGREHVEKYVATDGAEGHEWNGTHTLILTTHGRRSGKSRPTPLIYGREDDRYVVVASRGGAPHHPQWYLNLVDDPDVDVQVKDDTFRAHARTATTDEKRRLWPLMLREWPDYDTYQRRTERDIPVVILERAA